MMMAERNRVVGSSTPRTPANGCHRNSSSRIRASPRLRTRSMKSGSTVFKRGRQRS